MDNRRRAARFTVESLTGTMVTTSPVDIVNMSIGGVAFSVDKRLRVGDEYTLKLEVEGKVVTFKGTVAWSVLSEVETGPGGESVPMYSAGMKFGGVLSQETEGLLEFIDEHKLVKEHRLGGVRLYVEGKALLDLPESYTVRMVSLAGMLIETSRSLNVGDVLPMEISVQEGAAIRLSGRVASCVEAAEAKPRHYDIGIEFLELPQEDRKRLGGFIESLSSSAVG